MDFPIKQRLQAAHLRARGGQRSTPRREGNQADLAVVSSKTETSSASSPYYLAGGFNPSEEYESLGMIIPNMWENIKFPNHQPVLKY